MRLDVYGFITCSKSDYRFIRLNIKFGKFLIISIISAKNGSQLRLQHSFTLRQPANRFIELKWMAMDKCHAGFY